MDLSIFKAYDIRGIYPDQINEEAAYKIGRAFTLFVKDFYQKKEPIIIVSRDIRKSSEGLSQKLIEGITNEGGEVINIGLSTTPLNYFANWYLKADASAMVTASHNPKEHNGIKFSLKKVMALAEVDGVAKTKKFLEMIDPMFLSRKEGQVKEFNLINEYINFLKTQAKGIDFSNFKIAVDCGNGAVGPIFEKLAKELGLKYTGLYMDPDGNFPNHEPNPLAPSALEKIQELMNKEKFDLGVLFDGDGDRLMILNNEGELVKSDFLIALFAKHYLPLIENKKIPCDARISRGAKEAITQWGGDLIMCKVGYPSLRAAMVNESAFFGGELSGHYFWQDFSYAESALLTLIRLLIVLKQEKAPIKDLVLPFKTYFNSGEINFKVKDTNKKIKEIEECFIEGKVIKIDGITVEYSDWWFNIRPSNTEPLLRLLVEAKTKELFEEKLEKLKEIIQR